MEVAPGIHSLDRQWKGLPVTMKLLRDDSYGQCCGRKMGRNVNNSFYLPGKKSFPVLETSTWGQFFYHILLFSK